MGFWLPLCVCAALILAVAGPRAAQGPAPKPQGASSNPTSANSSLPRGQKLFLKDGSFQLVRDYAVAGDRVRYYSLDTHQYEEIPASMVDWDATKAASDKDSQHDAAIANAIEAHDKAKSAQFLDVDASIEIGPKIFLPSDVGLFAFDGKSIFTVPQAEMRSDLVKKKLLEQVLVPIPIIPTEHRVTISGPRAKLRLNTEEPEFYMRTADGREPEIDLIHAKVKDGRREVENLDQIMNMHEDKRDSMLLQRWTIAPGVFRFSLGQSLPAGEYVIAQRLDDQALTMYVWDFGVDLAPKPTPPPAK
jgi:hypothetical protein